MPGFRDSVRGFASVADGSRWRGAWLLGIAAVTFLAGVASYLLARETCFIDRLSGRPDICAVRVDLAQFPFAGSFPSFAHSLSIAVLLALVAGRRWAPAAIAGWVIVEMAMEAFQAVSSRGTFDAADLFACILGGAAALLIHANFQTREEPR